MDLLHDNKDSIEELRGQYEKHVNLVGLIQEIEKLQEDRVEPNEEPENEADEDEDLDYTLETTSEENIEKFIQSMKSSAKKTLEKNADPDVPSRSSLQEKAILLNSQQRLLFDYICERMVDVIEESSQFSLYLGGEAGCGKTFLVKLLKQSGDKLEKPKVWVLFLVTPHRRTTLETTVSVS